MGLDMYLYKKIYLGKIDDGELVKKTHTVNGKQIKFGEYDMITTEVAYWRKANAIHKWFVDECCDGVDDCREHFVSIDDLEELLSVCKMVKDNKNLAEQLLPTQSGCFFGSTEYDEGYFGDIDLTIEQLEKVIEDSKDCYGLYYNASW